MAEQFGQRLKALRLQRGLQQSDLSGPGVSVSYVSMLENGKREPTARVIAHLAGVLGLDPFELSGPTLADKLDDERRWALAGAELALSTGEHERARAEFAALEASVGLPASWGLARALEALGDLEAALTVLDRVVVGVGLTGDYLLLVRAHIARSRCFGEIGEDVAALEAAIEAATTIESHGLTGTDEHAQALSTLVGRYYTVGDLLNAETTARELLALVDAGSSWKARGSAYWNVAGVAEALGDLPRAVAYAERALALLSEGDDERAWARCAVACAWFWMRHPDAPEHLDAVDRLLAQAGSKLATSGTDTDLAYLETEQARAALLHGDPDAAVNLADRALERLGTQARAETADTLLVLAQAHLERGDHETSAALADQLELTLLSLPHSRPAAHTWRGLADTHKALGNHDAAYRALEHALNAHALPTLPTTSPRRTRTHG
ncbi:MAG: helix-turn-helix domain-containing protein [Actinomycetales bacterium]